MNNNAYVGRLQAKYLGNVLVAQLLKEVEEDDVLLFLRQLGDRRLQAATQVSACLRVLGQFAVRHHFPVQGHMASRTAQALGQLAADDGPEPADCWAAPLMEFAHDLEKDL